MPVETPAELTRLIGVGDDVVRAVCVFNQNPADYMDASHRAATFSFPANGLLWDSERGRRHLSREILVRIGGAACLDVQRPEWAFALLERGRLDRLARHIAAALVGARVRRSLSRAEVLQWRAWLSPEAHEFAMTRAGLLPGATEAAEAAAGARRETPAEGLGHAWLAQASKTWPESMAQRFALKLPLGASLGAASADAVEPAFAARLVSSVLSIVEARWCSSFATMRA